MNRLIGGLLLMILSLLLGLQLHNISTYPLYRGFDAAGHIEYVDYLRNYQKLPLANEGWELYQPPAFYLMLSWLPGISWQWLGLGSWLLIILCGYWVVGVWEKKKSTRVLFACLIGLLPVGIYLTPAIGNELFAASLISLALALYVRFKTQLTRKRILLLGLVLGLSLLSKATTWVVVAAITIDFGLSNWKAARKQVLPIMAVLGIALSVGGWFYLRNMVLLGNPFATSVDYPQFKIVQEPGYRDLAFWFRLRGFFELDLFRSHWDSFIPGTYFSFFYDGHNAMIPVQAHSLAGLLLSLAGLPLLMLAIRGWWLSWRDEHARVLGLYTGLLLFAYALYNLKLPFYSTVKGSFIASLLMPMGVFVYLALKPLHTKKQLMVVLYLLVYACLVVKNFWILPHWY